LISHEVATRSQEDSIGGAAWALHGIVIVVAPLIYAITIIVFLPLINLEFAFNNIFPMDDILSAILAVVAIDYLALNRTKRPQAEIKKTNTLAFALGVVILLLTLIALVIEGEPGAFGNDPPSLILSILLIVNRFI